ncbi:MAG: isoleucine--tRNA ligase [Anaerolineales bacterium]|nr:isoleucine--tRNA ligase [Anaerolineales bacterium]
MFKSVSNQVDFIAQEQDVLEHWEREQTFEKLKALRADAPRWSFLDGPITANNPMGVHHGWGRTYKDLFLRFKAMQGFQTRHQNGFDCQGLWVEVNVEREMGFKTKRDIEEFGLAEFVRLCKQRVLKYAAVQTQQSKRLGYWMDWNDIATLDLLREKMDEDPQQVITVAGAEGPVTGTVEYIVGHLGMKEMGGSYFTFSDENNYTIWGVLKSCYDRGWVYKGRDVMPWCARCGTGLSQHEIVTEGYKEITHPAVTLRFPLKEEPGANLLVWTTTPWTLTSNVAAAVGPELEYARVKQGEEILYLSKGTLHMLQGEYELLGTLLGSEMEGWTYEGPFDELPAQIESGAPEAHCVILWDEVGDEEGTGIVHIAPGCGAEDFQLGNTLGLPSIAPLTEGGMFIDGFDWLTGMDVKNVREPIFESLRTKSRIYKVENYTHRYPICWRCGEELVFRLVDEWYISMGEQLEKLYEEVTEAEKLSNLRYQIMEVVREGTTWYPSFGRERELDWLHNMHDWMISKKRYWGLALPIWECEECGHFEVIGSKEELEQRAVQGWDILEGHSPHRPYVDAVKIQCSECGSMATRTTDVGNPWLDAGIVAMSTMRYNQDRDFWRKWFPADLITESFPGQFRNWFYSLLAMSTILERKAPFKHVFTYATLLAEDGSPMHKSAGNAIEFNEAADKMGVDVMRWLFCSHKPEKDLLFGYHRADEVRRQFLLPLWNVYSFFVTYANIDGWAPLTGAEAKRSDLDRWITSRLHECIGTVTDRLEKYEPQNATEELAGFLDDVSNWYLRRSRRRFWSKAGENAATDEDKRAAYETLYEVLTTLTRLLAPFVPFVSEVMYQNLVLEVDPAAPKSVHHCSWPQPDQGGIDTDLTWEMSLILKLVSLGHAARNQSQVKVRQPLAEAAFAVRSAREQETVRSYKDILCDELNVKTVRLLDAGSEVVEFQLKPLPRQLGQKYGAKFPAIRSALMKLDPEVASAKLLAGDAIEIAAGGEVLAILPEEVEVVTLAQKGFSASSEGGYIAALNTALTEELVQEGLAREFVRRIQDLRKQADLQVDDRIKVTYRASARLAKAVEANRSYIMGETLAIELEAASALPEGAISTQQTFDDEELTAGIVKA